MEVKALVLNKLAVLARFAGAVGALKVVNDTFDWVVYPFVIWHLGTVRGGILLVLAALCLNYMLVMAYNLTKHDLLALEWLRRKRSEEPQTWRDSVLHFWLNRFSWVVISYMAWGDPFKAFVYQRGRMPAKAKFTRSDWVTLFNLNLLGNLLHLLLMSGIVEWAKRHGVAEWVRSTISNLF